MGQDYNIAVEGRAYLLRPDTPKEGLLRQPRSGETEDELSEPIRSQVREANLIMKPPSVTPNTMFALEATEYAQQHGKFMEFHHAAYRAYWEDRKDLGKIDVLAEIAASVSLDADEMVHTLEARELSSLVMGQYQEALQYGIRGIPTFVVGNLLFTGAHPYDIFKSAINQYLNSE